MEIFSKIGTFLLDIIETLVIALAIFVVVYLFLVQPHQVKGSSMFPTYYDNEYILTNKISYKIHSPERGDVVVFKSPKNEEIDFIKRIIGLPGDRIKVMEGSLYVNGKKLDESSYLPADYVTRPGAFAKEGEENKVPDGKYFTVGDNRDHSSDSREWGFVTLNEIVGKAWVRYWPLNRLSVNPGTKYNL